jgi:hypothetical protein
MANIRTKCPKCQRPLWATPDQAGKRVRCPECKFIMKLPQLSAALVEELAATEFSGQSSTDGAPEPGKPIKFHCSYCDEEIEFPAEMAGQRGPCPECTRIVKIPEPVKEGPRDWRKVERGAAAGVLRTGEKPPEGEWGTATASAKVTRQSLEEAQAIPIEKPRVPVSRRVIRAVGGVTIGFLIFVVLLVAKHFFSKSNQGTGLAGAIKFVGGESASSLTPPQAAEIDRALAEYYFGAKDLDKLRSYLRRARQVIEPAPESTERSLGLMAIAATQVAAAGPVPWDEVYKDLVRTVEAIKSPEARVIALQQVTQQLIERGQTEYAMTLANAVRGDYEHDLKAYVGLVLWGQGKQQKARSVAAGLVKPFQTKSKQRPPVTAALLALLLATSQTQVAEEISKMSPAEATKDPYPEARIGFACGSAYLGNWDRASAIAGCPGPRSQQFEAFLAVISAAQSVNHDQAKSIAHKLCTPGDGVIRVPGVSDWLLWRLVNEGLKAGVEAERLAAVPDAITDLGLKRSAKEEILRLRLSKLGGPDLQTDLTQLAADDVGGRSVEAFCRHNARYDRSASLLSALDRLEQVPLRPFGYVGVALGEQDSGR